MADIRLTTTMRVDLGSEEIRSKTDHIISGAVREHKAITVLADDAADGNVVLYDETTAAVNNAAGNKPFKLIEFLPDPEAEKSEILDIDLELRHSTSGQVEVVKVNRTCPLRLASDTVYDTLGGAARRIDRIRARNSNAAPASGNRDVLCLLRMLRVA